MTACLSLSPAALAVLLEPDNYSPGTVLNDVSPYVMLSVEVPDGQGGLRISTFDVTSAPGDVSTRDVSPTGSLVFAHVGIPFFSNDSRILRGDFINGSTSFVSLLFSPSSTLSPQIGRLEAYGFANNLLAFDETPSLLANNTAVTIDQLLITRPSADIAYFRAYTVLGSFGRYDALTFNTPVPETHPADLDLDGDIDDADFAIAFANFTGPDNGPANNPAADLDLDNDVDDADFALAFAAFTGPADAVYVPEPAAGVLLGVIALVTIRRKNLSTHNRDS